MKPKSKPAVNVKYVGLFNAACLAATDMAQACENLARALIGKGRGKDAYGDAIKSLSALEAASVDGNRHTVRRYTAEALAIFAQSGRAVKVSTVARERTEKAQAARKSLGVAPRGKKKPKATKKTTAPKPANFLDAFRAMLRLQAGRATLISAARQEGYDIVFSMRAVTEHTSVPSDAPKPNGKSKQPKAKANGASAATH